MKTIVGQWIVDRGQGIEIRVSSRSLNYVCAGCLKVETQNPNAGDNGISPAVPLLNIISAKDERKRRLSGRLRRRNLENNPRAVRAPVNRRAVEIPCGVPNDATVGESTVVAAQTEIMQGREGVISAGGA